MVCLLSSTRFARRDQANVRTAPRIDDDQQSFERIEADRYPPLLVLRVLVTNRDRSTIVEHRNCIGEMNAVLSEVGRCFVRIPLKAHTKHDMHTCMHQQVRIHIVDGEETFEVDAELEAVLIESIAQADRGETISAEALLREMRGRE